MHSSLSDIKVLDFTHLLPGELCSTFLSDLGCDIIRVEPLLPGLGRRLPPVVNGESLYYWSLHRNKRHIALDLKKEEAVAIVHRLTAQCDVVLENFRPAVMTRLGIGYEKLAAINDRIIYCSISGYGQNSIWNQRPGHDLNFVAEAGVVGMTCDSDGKPVLPGVLISDYMAGLHAALSVVTALYERQKTGLGKRLDISMFESALSTLNVMATKLLYTGEPPHEGEMKHPSDLPNYALYRCQDDRYLAVASLERPFWDTFCERLGRHDLKARHPKGPDQDLKNELSEIIAQKTLDEWLQVFEDSNCCVSPVNSLAEALDFLPARERNVITNMAHPILGDVPQLKSPVSGVAGAQSKSETQAQASFDAGVETAELLRAIGYSEADLGRLANQGVIPQLPQSVG